MKHPRPLIVFSLLTAALAAVIVVASVAAVRPAHAAASPASTPASPNHPDDLTRANAALATLGRTYRLLDDVRVEMGTPPDNKQAVSYYTEGLIVISPDHVAGVESIMMHEIWHIIDWRDNGRIDWAEDLPPANSLDYLN